MRLLAVCATLCLLTGGAAQGDGPRRPDGRSVRVYSLSKLLPAPTKTEGEEDKTFAARITSWKQRLRELESFVVDFVRPRPGRGFACGISETERGATLLLAGTPGQQRWVKRHLDARSAKKGRQLLVFARFVEGPSKLLQTQLGLSAKRRQKSLDPKADAELTKLLAERKLRALTAPRMIVFSDSGCTIRIGSDVTLVTAYDERNTALGPVVVPRLAVVQEGLRIGLRVHWINPKKLGVVVDARHTTLARPIKKVEREIRKQKVELHKPEIARDRLTGRVASPTGHSVVVAGEARDGRLRLLWIKLREVAGG